MANEIVGLKIQVDGSEATRSVGSLKQQLREAQADVTKLSEKFGATSQEAVNAAKKAADLRDRIGDAKSLTDAFNPDAKFRAFTSTLSGVAGGFAAVQGALGLVGVESDKVEKTLLKVQSAMAVSQGLQTLGESIDSFKQLSAVIQNTTIFQKAYNIATIAAGAIQRAFGVAVAQTSLAFRALRGAILATGIGVLVIGIGVLVDKIIDWTNRTSDAEKAQEKLALSTKKMNGEIDNQISVLTALGGKEEEIYRLRLQRTDNELNVLRNKLKTTGKLNEEEMAEFRKLKTDKEVLDIQEANRINKQQEEETKKRQEENSKVVEDRKARNEEIKQADADLQQRTQQLSDEIFLSEIEDEKVKEEIRIATQFERDKAEIERSVASEESKQQALQVLRQKYDNERKVIADQRSAEEVDALTNKLFAEVQTEQEASDLKIQNSFDELDAITNNLLAEVDAEEKASQAKKEIALAEAELKKQQLKEVGSAIQNLTAIVGEDTLAGKALGVATALINTYQGASEALKQKSTLPSPFDVIAKVANVAAIVATGIKTVRAITAVKVPPVKGTKGGSGSTPSVSSISGSAPITPSAPLVNTRTQLDSTSIQQLGSATNRSYVLESDVTNSQERIRRINRAARLS
jgi:myosin heavy subunit